MVKGNEGNWTIQAFFFSISHRFFFFFLEHEFQHEFNKFGISPDVFWLGSGRVKKKKLPKK